MPYADNAGLPPAIQRRLPPHAQDIYREAFNHAWENHQHDPDREAVAHRIAWAAVKRSYRKVGDVWMPKAGGAADV
jgi:cation transport regulator